MKRAIIYLLSLLVISCWGGGSTTSTVEVSRVAPQFSYPEIPAMITDDTARMRYFTEHYWDNYDFADSLLLHNDSLSGSAMAGYISLLQINDTTIVRRSIEHTLDMSIGADYDNFLEFTTLLERYLYDPNSPLRNEELYIPVLEYIVECEGVDQLDKLRPEQQLDMVLKNRVGELSADFEYRLSSGERRMMHQIDADYTILFFNSPDCEECGRIKNIMLSSATIVGGCKEGRLQILALYPDSNLDLWRSTQYDPIFINAYDDGQKITKSGIYDLRAIPTLYLLDREKRVVLKDVTIEQIGLNLHKIML